MSASPDIAATGLLPVLAVPAFTVEALDAALRSARVGVWEVRLPSFATTFSDSFYALAGVEPAAGRAERGFWRRRVHPEDLERVDARFREYAAGRSQRYEVEYRLRMADGRWRWMLARAESTWRDIGGTPRRIMGVTIDIHARREAEDSLRESEERFRLAATTANGIVYDTDLSANHTVMHGLEAMTGYADAAGFGTFEGWLALVHPQDQQRVRERVAANRASHMQHEMTYRILHRDGHTIHVWHRGTYVRDAAGRPVRAVGVIEDVTAPTQVQQALASSEFRLRVIANMSPGYIFQVTLRDPPQEDEIFVSPGFERLMGCAKADFQRGGDLRAFCDAGSRPRLDRAFDRMRAGLKVDVTIHGCNVRGEELWLRVQSLPVYDDATGRRTATIGAVQDITTERRAEIALEAERLKLQTLTAASPTQLALFDLGRRCLFANFSLSGRPVEEVPGQRIDELVPPSFAEQIRANFDDVVRTGQGHDTTEVLQFPGCPPRSFEIRMRPVWSEGSVIGVVTNVTDITEKRHAQESLNLQALIIETMREGVLLLDRSANILLTNPAIEQCLGYPRGTLVGRNLREVTALEPQDFADMQRGILADIDTGESPQREVEGLRADGTRLLSSCIFTGVNVAGESRLIAVLSDITERKQLEREVLQVATREQQRIGGDLHDGLGQELAGIAMLMKGVTRRLRPLSGQGVRKDMEHIIKLVNDAIESTRSLARGLSPVSADRNGFIVGLQELANRSQDFFGVPVAIQVALPDFLRFDENVAAQLYRIVQEAITNAIRHGKARHITVQLRVLAGKAQLAVTDDGGGFDPRQVTPSSSGLKIMRFRAQMIGGQLAVDSMPGAGTTIRCECPANTGVAALP